MDVSSQLREKKQKEKDDQRSVMYASAAMQARNVAAIAESSQQPGEVRLAGA